MAREIEKQLMKELERAVKEQDAALKESAEAKALYDIAAAKATKALDGVKALSGAIVSLRGNPVNTGWQENVVSEARGNLKKEKPVA
jgi:hypothetical protein